MATQRVSRRATLAGLAGLAGLAAAAVTRPAAGATRRLFDSHCHIIDPRFPLVVNQGYLPPAFPLDAYLAETRPLGVVAGAVVSGSFQAHDQSYLLDALGRLGPGWVGVTQIPADLPDAEIARLAAAGVRALRFNILRGEAADIDALLAQAHRAHAVAGWHAEIYADAATLRPHVDRLARLPRIAIDHLGMTAEGLPVVVALAEAGAFVKATGFGRVTLDVPAALERVAHANPASLVFGTDLPSTRARRRFDPTDIALIERVLGTDLAARALWTNPTALYRVSAA